MEVRRRIVRGLLLACALLWVEPAAHALDQTLDVTQYRHTAWRVRDGFVRERVVSIAQTSDGYLWLATRSGLLRFDGVRTVPWEPPPGASLPEGDISTLLGGRDGTLWIGTIHGLASWKEGVLTLHPRVGFSVTVLVEDRDGTLWVGGAVLNDETAVLAGRLCSLRGASIDCHGEDGSLGSYASSVYEDSNGSIWVAGPDRLWRWAPAPRRMYAVPEGVVGVPRSITEADGTTLVATRAGLRRVVGDALEPYPISGTSAPVVPINVFRDRDGGLWLATLDAGLVHVHAGRADTFTHADGLSGNAVLGAFFEDREGNVWALTRDGLDVFRTQAAVPYAEPQHVPAPVSVVSLSDGTTWTATRKDLVQLRDGRPHRVVALGGTPGASLLVDRRGRLWAATTVGLAWLEQGSLTVVDGVARGFVDSMAEDAEGGLWLAHRDAGLIRVAQGHVVDSVPWPRVGDGRWAWRIAPDPAGAGLWLGYYAGGVAHWVDGRVMQSYAASQGLGKGRVNQVSAMPDGSVWAATDGGLSRIHDGRVVTLDSRSGLPCNTVLWTIDDGDGARWLAMTCGLVRIARSDLEAWAAAADNGGKPQPLKVMVLDAQDGVGRLVRTDTFTPHAARASDGKLWFVAEDGLVAVDPHDLSYNRLPPPVHVEQVVADRTRYDASPGAVRLPPLVRDVVVDYTALSFVAPEKMRFRYKLEGQDADWREVLNDRKVQYSNLAPGRYRFRVTASNNSGVWSQEGASLDIEVAPAFWQTNWFRALCVVAFALLLFGLYRLRVRQLRRRFALTLETRVAERTRIARDLHDTLLQSFHGLLLRFQTARSLLPANPSRAAEMLDNAIDQAADAITEGRDAVQAIRASTTEMNNLAAAIRTLADELLAQRGLDASVSIGVEVLGVTRALHPIVRDEAFRIAGEALRNALHHAESRQIEVELVYDRQQFRLRVRDDGKGIDPQVLAHQGREGHFGLPGMRERAAVVGGKLTVWSALDAGTEIELTVPATNAYVATSAPGGRSAPDLTQIK